MVTKLEWNDFIHTIADFAGMEDNEIKGETNIYSDLGMDSLGLFSLGMQLIKKYSIKIPLKSVSTVVTVEQIFTLMNAELGKMSN